MQRFPSEREISAAFKRMVMKLPIVGMLGGHGERSLIGGKDRDYSLFANEKTFRSALMNQGFDVQSVSLTHAVPEDINIIVISDMREWLTSEEEANLQQYIDRGGNLFILGEPKRREIMNPLFAKFGFELTNGLLVKRDSNLQADVILSRVTREAVDNISYEFEVMASRHWVLSTPSVAGLEQIADKLTTTKKKHKKTHNKTNNTNKKTNKTQQNTKTKKTNTTKTKQQKKKTKPKQNKHKKTTTKKETKIKKNNKKNQQKQKKKNKKKSQKHNTNKTSGVIK